MTPAGGGEPRAAKAAAQSSRDSEEVETLVRGINEARSGSAAEGKHNLVKSDRGRCLVLLLDFFFFFFFFCPDVMKLRPQRAAGEAESRVPSAASAEQLRGDEAGSKIAASSPPQILARVWGGRSGGMMDQCTQVARQPAIRIRRRPAMRANAFSDG